MEVRVDELPVREHTDLFLAQESFHVPEIVRGYLVPASSRSRMYHGCYLAFLIQAECLGDFRIVNFLHPLYFKEMVSGPQGSQLRGASLESLFGDLGRIGCG